MQKHVPPVFLWRKRSSHRWLATNESRLFELAGTRLAIIETPNRKNAVAEIAGLNRRDLEKIRERFGGSINDFPHDWLRSGTNIRPLRVGKRLTIVRSTETRGTDATLVIPAGAAFGTGEHVTTAMSLRLLEEAKFPQNWSMLDLGTGSGILALAAKKLGAGRVVAIDSDPVAISVAEGNARLNRIAGITFRTGDARKFSSSRKFEIVSANLYSELLIETLPKLNENRRLIFSGVLREQEPHFLRALRRNEIEVTEIRRRGKWIALLCAGARISG